LQKSKTAGCISGKGAKKQRREHRSTGKIRTSVEPWFAIVSVNLAVPDLNISDKFVPTPKD